MAQLPAHPYQKQATRQIAIGAVFGALGLLVAVLGFPTTLVAGASFAALGGMFFYFGVFARGHLRSLQVNNAAYDLLSRGKITEAERLLDSIGAPQGHIGRAVELQRALIAIRRGDSASSEAHATRVLEKRVPFFARDFGGQQEASALAIRALARASAGNAAGAREDIARVRSHSHRVPEALARASVAEAISFARADEREQLARSLREGLHLVDYTMPRERALLRALRRMVAAPARSVYREPARPTEPREEPLLEEWVAKIAPEAAAYVHETAQAAHTDAIALPPPVSGHQAGSKQLSARANVGGKRAAKLLVLWGVPFVMFLAIWRFLSPSDPETAATHHAPVASAESSFTLLDSLSAVIPVLVALVFVLTWINIRRTRVGSARLREAILAQASGDVAEAERRFVALTTPRSAVRANAFLSLSTISERRGALGEALARCDEGIRAVSATEHTRAAQHDILVPELVTERAVILALSDRYAEAEAELGVLVRDFAAYPYQTRAVFRIRLMLAVRRGRLEEAAALARARTPELPLSKRDEMLADLVVAASSGASEDELVRIHAELREDAQLAGWIEKVAPGLRSRLGARAVSSGTSSLAAHPPEQSGDAERDRQAHHRDGDREVIGQEPDRGRGPQVAEQVDGEDLQRHRARAELGRDAAQRDDVDRRGGREESHLAEEYDDEESGRRRGHEA